MSQTTQPAPEAAPPFAVMMQMITGAWVSQAVCAAAELGIADLLKDGPRHCDDLAQAGGAHSDSLFRLLRALASVGVFAETDEPRALAILRNIHRALPADGRLLLVENVLPEGNAPHFGKLLDLEMLAALGGRERTAAEYAELFAAAGFRLNRVVPTQGFSSFIEGVKA
jgi:hypothetical protein